MDTLLVDRTEIPSLVVVEASEDEHAAQKKNAPELTALEALVACATTNSGTEYTPERPACQIGLAAIANPAENERVAPLGATHLDGGEYTTKGDACQIGTLPTLDEIQATIAAAAHSRIVAAQHDLVDTRARLERERTARATALQAVQERASLTKTALAGLADERTAIEAKAQAFLGGEELKAVLGQIHLAFNARQLELEAALAQAEAEVAEVQTEAQAASLSDALELQLAEQELERLQAAAPEVAQAIQLAATVAEKVMAAIQAAKEGMLLDAATLLEQAKAGHADPVQIAEAERVLAEARQAKQARDLIARVSANADQPGATRRIHRLMEEAQTAGIAEKVALFANRALEIAREAANARFAQARPIADHLASDGFIPVVGDGRIEAWKQVSRNGHGKVWGLDHLLILRAEEGWRTETPRNPITRKELPPRVRHSRWYHSAGEPPAH
jgi:hypothetical protein